MYAPLAITAPEKVVDIDAHEGPVYVSDEHALYFTTQAGRIKRLDLRTLDVTVVRERSNRANGMTLAHDGSLLVCEQGDLEQPARIARLDRFSGDVTTVVESWAGLPLNSPNDVVARSDSSIWFTDPSYGFLQGFRPPPQTGDHVYRYDPGSGRLDVLADSFDKPNGICFSPDEHTLYVSDSGANQEAGSYHPERPHHVVAFPVLDGRHLGPGRLFAVITPGFPDGLKTDRLGRVYASSSSGVQVFAPSGDPLGEIPLPGAVNFAFGGDRLYITNDQAVWAATRGD